MGMGVSESSPTAESRRLGLEVWSQVLAVPLAAG